MKIAVLIKYCPDSEAVIDVANGKLVLSGVKYSVSPYDEYACEEALRIVEAKGEGEVVVFNAGPEKNAKGIKDELARGAHRAVHIVTEEPVACPKYRSQLLAAALKEEGPDLILCGWKGIDFDLGVTGTMVAEMLEIPHVMIVTGLEIKDGSAVCTRQVVGGEEIIEVPLPAVIGAQKGLNEPRYPSLKGIMAAKKKPVKKVTPAELGVEEGEMRAKFLSFEKPPRKQAGKIFEGPESAVEVVRLLREEAKVI
jgi:electron transfer flavoprotein beta subunit